MTTSEFNWQTMPLIDGTWMQCTKSFGSMLNGFENVFKMINRRLCCSKSNCVYILHEFACKQTRTHSFKRVQILWFSSSPQNLCIENDLDYKVQQPHKVYQSTRTHCQPNDCLWSLVNIFHRWFVSV